MGDDALHRFNISIAYTIAKGINHCSHFSFCSVSHHGLLVICFIALPHFHKFPVSIRKAPAVSKRMTAAAGAAAATGAVEITLPVAIVAAAYIIGQAMVDASGD